LTYVQGLKHAGAIDLFAYLFAKASTLPSLFAVLVQSLIVTFGASVMNNWPMAILGLTSIKHATVYYSLDSGAFTGSVFANIIVNNLGPHFFPLGSLAILMWLGTMKRKGLTVRIRDYFRIGAVLWILEVTAASVILWLEITYVGLRLSG